MSSSLLDQCRYTISGIKLLDPPVAYLTLHKPIFLIKIAKITDSDNELLKPVTGTPVGKNQIAWSEQTFNDVTAESTINFKILMKKGKTGELETMGEYTNTVSGLLDKQKSSGICKVTVGKKSQLSFTVKEDRFKDVLDKAKLQTEGIQFAGGESWSTFLTYFGIVKTAVDSVTSLNPYARQVWSIVSIGSSDACNPEQQRQKIIAALDRHLQVYKADRLPVLTDTQSDKLKLLIDKTCDCADFIKKYTENNAAENIIKGPNFDDRISEFKESFDQIFKTIQDSLIIGIGIAASNIEDSNHLDGIPYAANVGFVHGKTCLPGTRKTLIKEILEWVDTDTPEHVLILSGQAGTGKSAIAHTIAETLNNRLGSFFCFSRSDKGRVNFLFSTISRDLADGDVLWRRNLVQATEKVAIRKSFDPVTQFNEMIIKPSNEMKPTKRVVIIIDALDESGDQKERQILLNLLFERSSELPGNYRIIITSRPEHDIARFHQHSNVHCLYMAGIDSTDTLNDIQRFISLTLSDVAEILDTVDKNWSLLLAQKAQSLFQWAKVTCGYILELEELEAAQRLRTVLSKPTSSLYEMYHQILDAQPGCQHDSYLALLKTLIGAVITSRKPLSVSALQAFFGPISGDGKNVKVVLKSLNSLFIGTTESTAELRPIHASLFDFFLDREQNPGTPNRYYIDTSDQCSFTHACLRVMNEMLRFNICGLETSHLRNRDVPNFNSRVAESVPLHLSYACCFWAQHLVHSRLNPDLLKEIYVLMHDKLLYFFEVLSLLGEIEHGRTGMQILKIKCKDKNNELAAWAAEASQFVFEFGTIMTESTPHLYLSSLPYISNHSFISQQFLPQYPQLLSMDVGQPTTLRPEIKDSIAQRHPSVHPTAIAFSPQGRQIACGFRNGDLWVWDYVTGVIVSRVDHTKKLSAVCQVVFSLNGELVYCCFRDGSILTWETKTNKVLFESNEGFTAGICNYCTISPDGRYIAFWNGYTLSFYERETRFKLFEDYTKDLGVAMFSPSGSFFGFQHWQGSGDREVHLWDTQRRMFIPPFVLITKYSFLKTLTDNYVIALNVTANLFGSLEVWDIRKRAIVRRFTQISVLANYTFSPNGEYLLHSEGNKRWIWKISTGEITQRFVEHSEDNDIALTALSPDSKYIAFTTRTSRTMHVLAWDALVQEEKDLSKHIKGPEASFLVIGAWLKGQHLLWKVQAVQDAGSSQRSLQIFDTTRMTGLEVDFQADPTGDRLISGDSKGNIKIWHVCTRQLISTSHGGLSNEVTALAFSPMGSTFWVAYYGIDEHAFIEERECSESQSIINGPFTHDSYIHSISIPPNTASICVCATARGRFNGSYDLRLLDRSTGVSIDCFNTPELAKFSSNRRYIAWVPKKDLKKVELWDLEKGIALDGHPFDSNVKEFMFSNDSRWISISGDVDEMQRVDIWDIETKVLVVQLFFSDFQFGFRTMALCEDSLLLVDKHGMGRIWDFHVHKIMAHLHDDHLNTSRFGMLPEHLQTKRLIDNYKSRSENAQVLDYALVAWYKASFSPRTKSEDGWMLGPHGELLFWVLPKMKGGLWYPCMSFTTYEKPTKLNFDKFVHGMRWTECGNRPSKP